MEQRRPAGRPHNVNRQAALVLSEKTYYGKKCKRCGSTERYTKGSGCVACQKTNAIEARQLLRAARRGKKPNSGDDLDFLETESQITRKNDTSGTRAHVFPYSSNRISRKYLGEGDAADIPVNKSKVIPVAPEKHLSTCASVPEPDTEPLCPQCGCGTEADHEDHEGWLRRTSPWRCTICEWEDPAGPPLVGESLDNDDWLG
jgi:hypothetical protein